ncbi:MAG TPA: DUF3310 domain-containing protein [Abditibacteriaceae bacterium]|jgi:hypothetical protein
MATDKIKLPSKAEMKAALLLSEKKHDGPKDPINPAHYKGDYVMRIIEDFELGFCLGNVIKYILRHQQKAGLEDLKKARWYLDRQIQQMESEKQKGN